MKKDHLHLILIIVSVIVIVSNIIFASNEINSDFWMRTIGSVLLIIGIIMTIRGRKKKNQNNTK